MIPEALADRPQLDGWQHRLYEAWQLLSPGRPIAVGMGAAVPLYLPAGEVLAMAEASGFNPGLFLRLCRELDTVYLAATRK